MLPEVEELEAAEEQMWHELHGSRPLDSSLLFTRIKRRALATNATKKDKERYSTLQRLRAKQGALRALVSTTPSSEWDADTLASDLEALQLDVRHFYDTTIAI